MASSGPLKKIEQALEVTELAKFFSGNVFSSYEVDSWKPEPGIFLHASKAMNVAPEQCLVVEDSEAGIEAGLAGGMTVVFYNAHQNKTQHSQALQVSSFEDILTLLNA